MNILVTGATGYIGKKLSRELVRIGHSVTAITRNADKLDDFDFPISIINIDLVNSNLSDLDLSKFDVIYNCAGELKNESLMEELHINATMKLLKCISNSSTRWVQLSSVGVYGKNISGIIDENSIFSPIGRYEVTKTEAEIRIKEYCLNNDIPFSILRPSNVFSSDMPNNSLRQLINFIKRGLFFYMKDPTKVMTNYVHVDDVVYALILCGIDDKAINNDYIVSDYLTQKEFVSIVCTTLGKTTPKLFIPHVIMNFLTVIMAYVPGLPNLTSRVDALSTEVVYSTAKIEKDLGYKKTTPLRQALVEFSLKINKNNSI
tara:strand:+ start:20242 stop:21192 length:951 start_codon:yes stop_codon:yes gene_type:complete